MKISLRGNKSIKAVFDSQVVRIDVFINEVSRLNTGSYEFSHFIDCPQGLISWVAVFLNFL
jgi:hypothetical protein